jgi:hypothetical protein
MSYKSNPAIPSKPVLFVISLLGLGAGAVQALKGVNEWLTKR